LGKLVWPATSLGLSFSHYEVQRREPGVSSDWWPIGRLIVENPAGGAGFIDYEIKKNVSTEYRVRVVRTDGGFSAWRNGNVAVTSTLTGCALVVTSNEAQAVLARNDTGDRTWEFLSADEWKFMPLYGRDYQVAFRSVSERGIRWPLELIMYGSGDQSTPPPAAQNWEHFEIVEAAFSAFGIQTVAVLTESGDRAFGVLRLLTGVRAASPGHLYLARVEFTQTSLRPVVVDRTFGT
jgi:hypothetical protein